MHELHVKLHLSERPKSQSYSRETGLIYGLCLFVFNFFCQLLSFDVANAFRIRVQISTIFLIKTVKICFTERIVQEWECFYRGNPSHREFTYVLRVLLCLFHAMHKQYVTAVTLTRNEYGSSVNVVNCKTWEKTHTHTIPLIMVSAKSLFFKGSWPKLKAQTAIIKPVSLWLRTTSQQGRNGLLSQRPRFPNFHTSYDV